MNKDIDKIKKMIEKLSMEDQYDLITELTIKYDSVNDKDLVFIPKFALRHQKEYQKDIVFEVYESKNNKLINVTLITLFGKFVGIGSNQKIAKINSVREALKVWD